MIGDRQRLIFSFDSEGSQGVVRDLERIERGGRAAGEGAASASDEARAAIEAQTEALRSMRAETDRLRSEQRKQAKEYEGQLAKLQRRLAGVGKESKEAQTDSEKLAEEIQKMGDERAFTQLRLGSKKYREELKLLAREQRKAERLQMTFAERLESRIEVFEGLEGVVGAVELLTMALVGLYNTVERGGVLRDLAVTMERIEAAGGASAASITAASGGRLTSTEGSQISLRGSLANLSAVDSQVAAELGRVLGTQLVQTGEAESVNEATNQSTRSIQDEIAAGEVGGALQALGVSQERYELALRRTAREQGTTADALNIATRREILRTQAMEAAGVRSRLMATELTDDFAKFEVAARNAGDFLAKLSSGVIGSGDEGDGRIRNSASKVLRQRARGFNQGGANSFLNRQIEQQEQLEEMEEERIRSAETRTRIQRDLTGLSAEQLETLGMTLQARTSEVGTMNLALGSFQNLTEEDIRRLATEEGINSTLTQQIKTQLQLNDRVGLMNEILDRALIKKKQELQSDRSKLAVQLAQNSLLSDAERFAVKRQAALIDEQLAAVDTVDSVSELNELFDNTLRSKRAQLKVDAEIAAEIANQTLFQTKSEQKAASLRSQVANIKTEAAALASNQAEYAQNVTKAAIVAALENNEKLSKGIERALKGSKISLDEAVNAAARLGGVLGTVFANVPGAGKFQELVFGGALDKPDKKKSGGSGKADARDALLFQAGLIGLDDLQQARAEAQRELEKNLELAGQNAQLVEAAHKIFWDQVSKAEDEALEDLEKFEMALFERYAAGVSSRLALVANTVNASRARLAQLSDLAIQEQLQGSTELEREFAEEMMALEQAQQELRMQSKFHGEERLRQEALFEEQRAELRQKQLDRQQEEDEREAEQLLQKAQRQAQHFADARRRTAEFDTYVQERFDSNEQTLVRMFDAQLVAGEQATMLVGQIEAINKSQADGAKKTTQIVGASVAAAGAVTASMIKNQRARAAVLALMEVAHAAAAFATPNPVKGVAHLLAAAKYGVVAAVSPKSAKPKVKENQAPSRRSLAPRPDGSGRTQRDSGPIVINQVFVRVDPMTGEKTAESLKSSRRRGKNVTLPSEMIKPSVRSEPRRLR